MRIGIDVGTATSRIAVAGKGVVVREPSVIADCGALPLAMAVGEAARRVLGRTPAHIQAIQPLRRGVVGAPVATREMLTRLLVQAVGNWKLKGRPQAAVAYPSRATLQERGALAAACQGAGCSTPVLIPMPVAAAFGADPEVARRHAVTVLDLGAGHTEAAVIAPDILLRDSISLGGEDLDRAIAAHLRTAHQLEIGLDAAEELKLNIGSAHPDGDHRSAQVWGREMSSGLPREVGVTGEALRAAMGPPLQRIASLARALLDAAPPALASDLLARGLVLTGGAARLNGLDRFLAEGLGVQVTVAVDASGCAARGAIAAAETGWREV